MKKANRTKTHLFNKTPRHFKRLLIDEPCPCGGDLYRLNEGERCLATTRCDRCGQYRLVSDCLHGGPPEGTHDKA